MKKSTLKEAIKSKIKSLLSEGQMTTDEAFRVLRNIQNNYLSDQQKDVMGLALDALQAAEVSRMMDRERGLNESLNPEVTTALNRFIKAMAKRYDYEEQDAVYAIMAALEQRKSDTKYDMPGFGDTMDALDDISIREEEDPYGEGYLNPQLIRYKNKLSLMIGDLMDINTKIEQVGPVDEDIADVIDILDRKVDQLNKSLTNQIREEEEPTSAELKKKDSIATTSNKLQKLTKKMKDKAKEFKAAEGDAKDKIKDELKKMTKEKKQLEKAL